MAKFPAPLSVNRYVVVWSASDMTGVYTLVPSGVVCLNAKDPGNVIITGSFPNKEIKAEADVYSNKNCTNEPNTSTGRI